MNIQINDLEQELKELKANYLLNSEKLSEDGKLNQDALEMIKSSLS